MPTCWSSGGPDWLFDLVLWAGMGALLLGAQAVALWSTQQVPTAAGTPRWQRTAWGLSSLVLLGSALWHSSPGEVAWLVGGFACLMLLMLLPAAAWRLRRRGARGQLDRDQAAQLRGLLWAVPLLAAGLAGACLCAIVVMMGLGHHC